VRQTLGLILHVWGEAVRKIGFLVLLVVGSAAAGFIIAWPLWYFATSARVAFTAFALGLAGCGIVFGVVRAILRGRNAPRDTGARRRSPLSSLLGALQAIILLCGLYLGTALFYRGMWIFAVPLLLICFGLLALLGLIRRGAKASRGASIVPKIRKE
jgi:1,4-dihydroxy-2-naphthoate octaprenyltransferase